MAISAAQAKDICTLDEFQFVESSFSPKIDRITPGRLRQKVERARKLQDKYRDLSRRQNRATKGADTDRTRNLNERTAQKAQLFEEVRERFEKKLAEHPE